VPDCLVFALDSHRFALPAAVVVEVARVVASAPLPGAPEIVEGAINVRGTIVPVLDVRARFGLPAADVDPDQHLILARAGRRVVALRVDRALALVAIPDDAFEPVERVAPGTPLVAGVARLPDGVLVIHDIERFLSLDEAQRLDAVVVSGPAA
jgi:purine-binding chemotaxis protein CheW